jgi:signal transduction histidine kinase/CheY-like chemotaxis protein/HPt (histidine-containing phosphotransfer) domain-containing protein
MAETPETSLTQQTILIRWMALASATGAAVSSAISLWLKDSSWLNFSVISSMLAVYCVASLWLRIRSHTAQQRETELKTIENLQEVSDLRTELEKHKSFELDLKKSKLAAESAAMAKSEFLATMSHEIRTPLNGIIPMLDLLANSKLGQDQAEILSTARSSAGQMMQIVDDILDYSKLEANKLRLETTSLNLREIATSVVQMFNSQAEAKRIGININLDPSVRLALRGDPVRLRQVLSNILSNAIKFTDKGSVSLTIRTKSETRQHLFLRFEIKDTGIGISPDDASRLFKPFSQADASTTRLYGGTGLGLVICKRIVDLMSGQIGVDSQPGQGSTFWFEIPMLKAVSDSEGMASDLKNAAVVLFSSDPILCSRFEKANSLAGARLTVATTVFEAQRLLKDSIAVGDSSEIDLLIIDVSSGRQSAIQLQKALLANSEFERLRIALLHNTDSAPLELGREVRRKTIARNMEMTHIFAELNKLLSGSSVNSQSLIRTPEQEPQVNIQAAEPPFVAGHSMGMVLLVEDNPVNLLVAQRLLQLANFDYISAENGEVALELLQQHKFDLVLMDCQMPVLDGYRTTQAWRIIEQAEQRPHLPIIAMTANAMAEDRQKCLDAGMDDYLSKPVDRKLLQQLLKLWLQRSKENAAKVPAAATAAATASPATDAAKPDPATLIDSTLDAEVVADFKAVMGGEYESLIRIYLEDGPKLVSQILSALSNRDCAALITPAHTLKSSSANLGAMVLSKLALAMEKSARAGDIVTPGMEAKRLIAEFENVQAALRALLPAD